MAAAPPSLDANRRLLRARDTMDRDYARPLDIPTLARIATYARLKAAGIEFTDEPTERPVSNEEQQARFDAAPAAARYQ